MKMARLPGEPCYVAAAVNRLKVNLRMSIECNADPEVAHSTADAALMTFLKDLNHPELAKLFDRVERWYA